MVISLIKDGTIKQFILPKKVYGNYWITDTDAFGNVRNLINVEAKGDDWILNSNYETKIIAGGNEYDNAILKEYNFYYLRVAGEATYITLYVVPGLDKSYNQYVVNGNDLNITIGNRQDAVIRYSLNLVAEQHSVLKYTAGKWQVTNYDTNFGTYVNNELIKAPTDLKNGDVVFVLGMKIIVISNFLVINNPNEFVHINNNLLSAKRPVKQVINSGNKLEENVELYTEKDYFLRAPRFKTAIVPTDIKIDPPPQKESDEDMPLIYTLGPMIMMGMTSSVMGLTSIIGVMNGTQTWLQAMPGIVIMIAMMAGMVLFPMLSAKYQKRNRKRKEKIRQTKYLKYLEKKRNEIATVMRVQKQILLDNNMSLEDCEKVIHNRKRELWDRENDQDDFLSFRLGIGNVTPQINIGSPEEQFTLDEDNLMETLQQIVDELKEIPNVPITMNLFEKKISAVVGEQRLTKGFIESMLLQLITFHSYEDLKIVCLTSEENASDWEYLKILPHCWNNEQNVRFFATNADEMKQVSMYLETIFNTRLFEDDDASKIREVGKNTKPYYLVITDNLNIARNIGIVNKILETDVNSGFSLIIRNDNLSNLPNECSTFVNIGGKDGEVSGYFANELVANNQKNFVAELNRSVDMYAVCRKLANIPIKLEGAAGQLPKMLSFLEMYNIGKVEQLNVINRWEKNNPILSLAVPVGVDASGEQFKLDLHEKFHGPHGLIAGMTGSGKSEFIITYILSLAANFHPDEVSFVLIDYKGGGLAGAFENKETGIKLPHLAGTITNLDMVEINRSLASIESELKKRQAQFNEARDQLSESTVDIYKYQRLYREGKVKEPMSHLFIISDEFAELKMQQPEFMDQLISTARIGRSLGVHLILATQKPSGIVDDQIWSNSKFRVCLKVQDKSDSQDMIRLPDAAMLKEAGRFYLQVGFNEYFALGQSAWCGAQYFPTEKLKKKKDTTINFIDNIGYVIRTVETEDVGEQKQSSGEELPNIMKYLSDIAKEKDINVQPLWLPSIPAEIFVNDLRDKYKYTPIKFEINPIIGEYDDPSKQYQGLLTLPMREGNVIVYGAAGSGSEIMLNTIVYSTIMTHSPEEVNLYLIDFGGETLTSFKQAPQVGDVLLSADHEKIMNLIKMLQSEIAERKQVFADYNGDYYNYINQSGEKKPAIIVMINNFEGFNEVYEDLEDIIASLTRDGSKYGIYFILSASSSNGIRYRLLQNFKTHLVLQMNDEHDYTNILGNVDKKEPSKIIGRGLFKQEGIYEFQTAYPFEPERVSEYIKAVCIKLNDLFNQRALPVPILPERVNAEYFKDEELSLSHFPVGVTKEMLRTAYFDLKSKYISIITSNDLTQMEIFGPEFIKLLTKVPNQTNIIIDAEGLFTNENFENCTYESEKINEIFVKITQHFEAQEKVYKQAGEKAEGLSSYSDLVITIIGFGRFVSKLNDENMALFDKFMSISREFNKNFFILMDVVTKIKEFEYEDWYKATVNNNYAIYLGNGITDQYTIKLSSTPRELNDEIPSDFGYVVLKGKAALTKMLSVELDDNGEPIGGVDE